MKAIHKLKNWEHMYVDLDKKDGYAGLFYRKSPKDKDGQHYPPIPWRVICRATSVIERQLKAKLPQVWTSHDDDHKKVLGVVWEICAKYEHGEFDLMYGDTLRVGEDETTAARKADKLDKIKELVCAVHQHLGPKYDDFVAA